MQKFNLENGPFYFDDVRFNFKSLRFALIGAQFNLKGVQFDAIMLYQQHRSHEEESRMASVSNRTRMHLLGLRSVFTSGGESEGKSLHPIWVFAWCQSVGL